MGKTYITGSNGFIGKHLMKAIPDAIPVIPPVASCFHADDTVIHLANRVPITFDDYMGNIDGMERMLTRSVNGSRIVYLSSSVVYMPGPSLYKASKMACEELCNCYRDKLDITVIRPFNVYGPGQSDGFIIPTIIGQVLDGQTTIKVKNPDAKRTFVYVDDVIKDILTVRGDVSDIGGREYSVRDLVKLTGEITGKTLEVEPEEEYYDDGPQPQYVSDDLVTMREGLKRTIEYFEEHKQREKVTL